MPTKCWPRTSRRNQIAQRSARRSAGRLRRHGHRRCQERRAITATSSPSATSTRTTGDKVGDELKAEGRYSDFRKAIEHKGVDVVLNGTPDHWHTLVNIHAMRSGKDVYSEKPLTLTIDEGQEARRGRASRPAASCRPAASSAATRGSASPASWSATAASASSRASRPSSPAGLHGGPFKTEPVPAELDWDFWLGQTPAVDYVPERCHFTFRYWYDYSGGTMTDWGAHHNDIALWGLGLERSGPVTVEGKPLVEPIPGGFTAPSEYDVHYTYANGVTHHCHSTPLNGPTGATTQRKPMPGRTQQRRRVQRQRRLDLRHARQDRGQRPGSCSKQELPASAERLYVSNDHMGNFFDCVQSRKPPICEPEIGHRSVSRLPPRRDRHPPRPQAPVGPREGAVRRRRRGQQHIAREMRKPWSYDAV